MRRSALCFPLLLASLMTAQTQARAETVWWEAEAAKETTMPQKADPALSGGQGLFGPMGEGLGAAYSVAMTAGGRYAFAARRFWLHGAFRWRFTDAQGQPEGDWVTVQGIKQTILDQTTAPGGPLCWVDLGYVTLAAGTHTLRVEMVPDAAGQPANFNKQYGFDCFYLSNDGFAPQGADPNGGPHKLPELPDPKTYGLHLPRTMALLESATPEHRTVVTILFYGQSIVANSHIDLLLTKYLREKYPNAEIRFKNTAIGGYEAPLLHRTCWQDLYCENPDLVVFHDYGGETTGEYEEMMKGIQDNLVAEVLSWTHHVDNFGTGIDKQRDVSTVFLKEMGAKYRYEMVDLRALWKEMLRTTHLPEQTFLVDQIHLNPKGSAALLDILTPHFVTNPDAADGWKKRIVDLPLDADTAPAGVTFDAAAWGHVPGGLVAKGTAPLRIEFTGNRLDLCGFLPADATGKPGTAKILLDGKAPSTLRETLTARRSTIVPGGWWPAITRVTVADNAVPEKVTLHFHDLAPDGSTFAFDAVGSVSGNEGTGQPGAAFAAKSGRWSIAAEDLALDKLKKITKKDLPPTLDIEFPIESMSLDAWSPRRPPKPGFSNQDVVVRSWKNGPHVVEIVPTGDGPVGVAKAVAYAPGPRD